MKKIFAIALVLALATVLSVGSVALADDLDADVDSSDDAGLGGEINVTWDGTGWVGGHVTSGDDAETWFYTEADGSHIKGSFAASKTVNTTYPYMGVDTYSCYLNAEVEANSWAEIEFWTDRTDSYGYGGAGQSSYNDLYVVNGSGSMAMGSWTNYAAQKDCCYNQYGIKMGLPNKLNGHHYTVSNADYFEINKYIEAGDGDWAQVYTNGSGSAYLDCMNSTMSGGGVQLGRGCGCYTDADFGATGSGSFIAEAHGNNYAEIYATGANSYGSSASVAIIASWVSGGCSIPDYSVTAN